MTLHFTLLLTDNSKKKILGESLLQSKIVYKMYVPNEQHSNKPLLELQRKLWPVTSWVDRGHSETGTDLVEIP